MRKKITCKPSNSACRCSTSHGRPMAHSSHGVPWRQVRSNHQRARRGGRIDGTKRARTYSRQNSPNRGALDPATMAGTLRIIPVVNLPGFRAKSRYLPDGRDLTEVSPDMPRQTPRGAWPINYGRRYGGRDAIADIHTAAKGRSNMPQPALISPIHRRTSWPKPSAPRSCSIPNRPEVASGEPQTRRIHASPSKAVLRTPCNKRR